MPQYFLVPVQPLSSPSRVPRLFFGSFLCFLSCRCFSPVLCVSPSSAGFPFGYSGVGFCLGVAAASAVRCCCFSFSFVNCGCCLLCSSVVSAPTPFISAPLFLHTAVLGIPSCLLLHFFSHATAATTLFPLSPGFPHAAASSAPSSLSPLLPLVASPAASYYSAVAPFIHFCSFSGGGSSGFYSSLPCVFCSFSCPVFHRIRRFSSLCFLGQLPLSLSPLCASLRFSLLRLQFLLCCYTWLSLGVSTAFCCLCLVRISGSFRDVVSLWDESGFAEVSLSFS